MTSVTNNLKEILPFQLDGIFNVPSSKSYFQRALAVMAFADGNSILRYKSISDDAKAALNCIQSLGAITFQQEGQFLIQSIEELNLKPQLNVQESGLSLRMFAGILASMPVEASFHACGSLLNRSLDPILNGLKSLGIKQEINGFPFVLKGREIYGNHLIDGSLSSQFISGLIIGLCKSRQENTLKLVNPTSKNYILMSLEVLKHFGASVESIGINEYHIPANQQLTGKEYTVPGDWSAASNFIVGALLRGGLQLKGLDENSIQADAYLMDILDQGAAKYSWNNSDLHIEEQSFPAFDVDATDCPDLIPALVLLAAGINGTSRIKGSNRLINKESNRLEALIANFSLMGLSIKEAHNTLIIKGTGKLKAAKLNGYEDHRMVMTAAFSSMLCNNPVQVSNPSATAKSYPEFFKDLAAISRTV